jgi:hypothetical protein
MKDPLNPLMYFSEDHGVVKSFEEWEQYYATLKMEDTFANFYVTLTPVRPATEEEKAKEPPKDTGFLIIMGDNGQSECWIEV